MKKNKGVRQASKNGQHIEYFKLNGKVNYRDKSRRHVRERRGGGTAARKVQE